jgi:hypothetical protein
MKGDFMVMRLLDIRRHSRVALFTVLLCALGATAAWGQTATGGITGTVADPAGALIPGATITATQLSTGFERTTVSGPNGNFLLPLLDPGTYRVEVAAAGFKKLTREPIVVRVTEIAGLGQMALEIGSTTESVTVTGEAPLLQTESATTGNVFDSTMVADLPLVTRNFTQLLALQAGVVTNVPVAAAFGNGTQGFSSAGSRFYDNNILINGSNAVSVVNNGSYHIAVPAPDTVEEFKVQSSLYSAEYGQAGGASVNLVTKNGTNKFHGDLYEFFRNNVLNANEYFYKASQIEAGYGNHQPILRQNQFGGTFGGPILKNHTFFFFGYQGTRQINGATPGFVYTLPAYPYLPSGDRSNTSNLRAALGAIYGGRTGFPAGICALGINCVKADGSNINPVAISILQQKLPNGQYWIPSFPQSSLNDGKGGAGGGQVYSNASFSLPGHFDADQYMLNLEHQISSRQILSLKIFTENDTETALFGNLPGISQRSTFQNRNFSLTHTFTFTPTLANEARVSLLRVASVSNGIYPFSAADVGMKPAPDAGLDFPWFLISNSGISAAGESPYSMDAENQIGISDTVSKDLARHSFRFGGLFTHHRLPNDLEQGHAGGILMYSFADFLIGEDAAHNGLAAVGLPYSNILDSAAGTGSFAKDYRFDDLSLFFQDDWKVTNKLTLNLGVRWDRFEWPHDINGRMAGFDPSLVAEGRFGIPTAAQGYSGFTLSRDFPKHNPNVTIPAGVSLVSNTLVNGTDAADFGPRIGFAWQPFNRWSIRGGYGIFFSRPSDAAEDLAGDGLPFNAVVQEVTQASGTLQDPFTYLNMPADSAFPVWQPRQYVAGHAPGYFNYVLPPNEHDPLTEQWNFGVQRQFRENFLIEVGYLGSQGQRLYNTLAGNQPGIASASNPIRGITTNTHQNMQDRAPVAGVIADEGIALHMYNGKSLYNAGLVSLSKRMSHGLQFLSAFTYSKSRDNNSGGSEPPGDNNYNNHWGLSDWDRTLRSTTSLVYALPDPMKNRNARLDQVVGGWKTAAIMTFQTGTPTTFVVNPINSAVISDHPLTPDLASGMTFANLRGHGPVGQRLTNFFGTPGITPGTEATIPGSTFVYPGPLDYGQLGRNLPIRSPGQKDVDFSAFKVTPIHEGVNLEFRAEFFNVFNWVNFGAANPSVDTTTFGYISSTTVSPRIIQLALKVNF